MQTKYQRGLRRGRRGIQVLEVVLLLPVLIIATFSFFVLGPTITVSQTTQNAAEEIAREVAKKTGTQTTEEITTEVLNQILSVHGLSLATPGVLVVVEEFEQIGVWGDTSVSSVPVTSSVTDEDQVVVTLFITTDAAPIPNVLSQMKFDISGRTITHQATAFRDS